MSSIGNNTHTLLHGLSDFWTRFFADSDELEAMYQATEILLAQTYLDMLSSFLNISVQDTPLFNKELFKLITVREDELVFDEAGNPSQSRHVYSLPDAVVSAHILQNKVYDPTASLESDDYELDDEEYDLRFKEDVAGLPGKIIASTTEGSLLTFGTGELTRLYVSNDAPFAKAKVGHWVKIEGSGSGNSKTFRVGGVVDEQAVLLQGDFTLPEANNGVLVCYLLESEFTPLEGFPYRVVTAAFGGSFDDVQYRRNTEVLSWYAESPQGLGIRKGDIIRVLDEEAVPTIPADLVIDLVRHDKLYIEQNPPISVDLNNIKKYVILREPPVPDFEEEVLFAQVNQDKTGANGSLLAHADGTEINIPTVTFAQTDRQRYITLQNCGVIQWTADLAIDGTLTWKAASTIQNPLARAFETGSIKLVGTVNGQDGEYYIDTIVDDQTVKLQGSPFLTETNVIAELIGITNDGTYPLRKVYDAHTATFSRELAVPDLNNGVINWEIHDGYKASLSHTRIKRGRVEGYKGIGAAAYGGVKNVTKNEDYIIEHETGVLTQVGLLAGTWGIDPLLPKMRVVYRWYREVTPESAQVDDDIVGTGTDSINATTRVITLNQVNTETALFSTTGFSTAAHKNLILRISGSSDPLNNRDYQIEEVINTYTVRVYETPNSSVTEDFLSEGDGVYTLGNNGTFDIDDTEAQVNQIAFWAPDARVDKFHLYNNYGYLIERFQASSETYREFIRGVFQLYMLGPTLEHIESALNVISGFPVIRDDDELLLEYDNTSSATENYIRTERLNGEEALYAYPKAVPIRSDITSYVPGTSDEITFHAFEPVTTMFVVTDNVEDPTWWDNIIIPQRLLPGESTQRRTTFPVLYENIVGQLDDPRIGDPGLFVGADDEGIIPAYGDTWAALRRKMANVVMERFLRWNMFFVSFDTQISAVLSGTFIADLQELILIAKPSYKYLYIEPASDFVDTLRVLEDLQLHVTARFYDYGPNIGEQVLTVQAHTWNVGDVHRRETPQSGLTLLTADGSNIPSPVTLGHDHLIAKYLVLPVGAASGDEVLEFRDYIVDYETGTLTPLTVWPAGTYNIDYQSILISPAASKDASQGDTDYVVGAPDPSLVWYKRRWFRDGVIDTVNGVKRLTDSNAGFDATLHRGKRIILAEADGLPWRFPRIIRVDSPTVIRLSDPNIPTGTAHWMPLIDEDEEAVVTESGGHFYLTTAYGFFTDAVLERYIVILSTLNPTGHPYRVIDVVSPNKVELAQPSSPHSFSGSPPPDLVADTGVFWQLRGSPDHLDLIERPLQIAIN